MYLSIIFGILFLCCALSFFENLMQEEKYAIYALVGFALIVIAAFRPEGMDNDFEAYVAYIIDNQNERYKLLVEWSFLTISELFMNIFDDYRSVFLLYAMIGVTVKMYSIHKLSPLLFAPLAVYIGNYFIIHEFTQIRAGVACAFIMLAFSYYCESKKLLALCFICVASFFHYSSTVMLPMLFLSTDDLTNKKRLLWALIVPFGYMLYFLHVRITELPIPFIGDKLELYKSLRDIGFIDQVNVFNMLLLLKCAIFYFAVYYYELIKENIPCFTMCLKLMGISLFCFIALVDLPVLAFRISELCGFVEIVLVAGIVYTIKPNWVGNIVTIMYAITQLSLHAFSDGILVIM